MTTTKKIMIVDDDEDDMEFFCEAVKEVDASCACITATNGEEALQKLRKGKTKLPDLIFLDLNMPRMDGKTCLRELKKDRELKNIPVIISTTSSHHKDMEETLELGAVHFMTKSSTFDQIKTGIEKALQMVGSFEKSN
ncbi:response regulator [Pricia antarctica]|nr:response regulator [Pricia antarctica]